MTKLSRYQKLEKLKEITYLHAWEFSQITFVFISTVTYLINSSSEVHLGLLGTRGLIKLNVLSLV